MRRTIWRALRVLILLTIVAFGLSTRPAFGQSGAPQTLIAGGTISYAPGAGAVLVDPDLTITGGAAAMLDAAVVSIGAGFEPAEDTLGISGQTSTAGSVNDLSWSYDTAAGVMTFTGEATLADYQAALRQVTFSNSSENQLVTDRSVSISLGSAAYYAENGHFYEYVSAPRITWTEAKPAAEAMTYGGRPGYLVTITSAGEGDFVSDRLVGSGWIGASDEGHDKEWRWETGPEAGMHFFTQASDATGCGQGRAETQPSGDHYVNWDTDAPEPNDFPAGCTDSENHGYVFDDGLWNDLPEDVGRAFGYIVEYGGMGGEPADAPAGTILIQAYVPSITIENTWVGNDPEVAVSFTIIPEADGCTAEQTVSLPAGQASVDVPVEEETGQTACTYTVTETAPVGYTVSPDEVTAVGVDGTAAFTTTETPVDALASTGSTNSLFVILGLALAGSGWFVLGGGRRRETLSSIDVVEPVGLLPDLAWTERPAALALAPTVGEAPADADVPTSGEAPADADSDVSMGGDADAGIGASTSGDADADIEVSTSGDADAGIGASTSGDADADSEVSTSGDADADAEAHADSDVSMGGDADADIPKSGEAGAATRAAADGDHRPTESAFVDAVVPQEPQPEKKPPAAIQSTADDVTETISKPRAAGGHSIVDDLLRLLDDLAED